MSVSVRLREEIRATGPISYERLIDAALYDPTDGFYAAGGRAGRRGDFITSPEVGPLFGALVARRIDAWWSELGCPDPFVVADVGAGPGTLGRAVVAAKPASLDALRYCLVEVSEHQRSFHPTETPFESFAAVAAVAADMPIHVAVANELLDNLPCRIVERHDSGWKEVMVDLAEPSPQTPASDAALCETHQGLDAATLADLARLAPDAAAGSRAPLADRAVDWVRRLRRQSDRLLVFDYGAPTAQLVERAGWLRTYRGHDRGGPVLEALGTQDITYDVPFDQLPEPDVLIDQTNWLVALGIDDLVEDARSTWVKQASVGGLEALRARSTVNEYDALTDPSGLGSFMVGEWSREEVVQ